MNILVYAHTQSPDLHKAISVLKHILVSRYSVQSISTDSLLSQPWQPSCALLVLISGGESAHLTGSAAGVVEKYVESGGSLLGLGYEVRKSSSGLVFRSDLSMLGVSKPFRLHDKQSGNTIYPRPFTPTSLGSSPTHIHVLESGGTFPVPARVNLLQSNDHDTSEIESDPSNIENMSNLTVLARFEPSNAVAGSVLTVGSGRAGFWPSRLHMSFSEPQASAPSSSSLPFNHEQSYPLLHVLTLALRVLDIQVPTPSGISLKPLLRRPLPQNLCSNPRNPGIIQDFLKALACSPTETQGTSMFKDANDTFYFHDGVEWTKCPSNQESTVDTKTAEPTECHIILSSPPSKYSPLFNSTLFFDELQMARETKAGPDNKPGWRLGDALLYGPLVTSTQTMFDKNPRFLSTHPVPLLALASYQLQGRGRGKNEWVSPSGCLMMSFSLRANIGAQFGLENSTAMGLSSASRLVFVQYIAALAVVEGVRTVLTDLARLHNDDVVSRLAAAATDKVKIKWPNDIYVTTRNGAEKKIGGVLVNSSFGGGKVDIVVGVGLNVLSLPPLASVMQLLPPELFPEKSTTVDDVLDVPDESTPTLPSSPTHEHLSEPILTLEHTAASILATFDDMWDTFITNGGSFDPFIELYLKRWMHSDQLVTLTTITPPMAVRIVGITPDHGLLRTLPVRSGGYSLGEGRGYGSDIAYDKEGHMYIDLQPDGNSFDLMAGMIRVKTST